ncbi:hypothetical protein IWQ61_010088, partial [Dispira simplex]
MDQAPYSGKEQAYVLATVHTTVWPTLLEGLQILAVGLLNPFAKQLAVSLTLFSAGIGKMAEESYAR